MTVSIKISWFPTIITYNLASFTTKSSSLSLTSKNSTPWVEGIFVAGTSSVDIGPEDIEHVDIEPHFPHPAFVRCYSLNRYPLFSLAAVDMLSSLSHHGSMICTIYSIKWLTHLRYSVSINILPTDTL